MRMFKYNSYPALSDGVLVNNATSKLWVERYRDPGEFKVEALLSSGLRELMTLGSFVSHQDTKEIMIVENHKIPSNKLSDPTIEISGRSLQAFLDERVVGLNQNWAAPPAELAEFELELNKTWDQAVTLIENNIRSSSMYDADDGISNMRATTSLTGTGVEIARTINRGSLLERLTELLAIDDLGVKVVRANTFPGGDPNDTYFVIHKGEDRSDKVVFSWLAGDFTDAEYLFTTKNLKNSALVVGRYVETAVVGTETGLDRRWMIVDASDIDGNLSATPTGTPLTTIRDKMTVRGNAALDNQKLVTITSADISDQTKHRFRRDYDVGDLVRVDGNYGASETMRVTEYTEIEDKNGVTGHPTLAIL